MSRPHQESVILVPPDPNWPRLAQEEAERFALILKGQVVRVHHIGSTSIPGIWAKPVIDLAPEVADIRPLDNLRARIEAAGYEFRGEYGLPERRFCPRLHPDGRRLANLHCYATGSQELFRHLAFRDYLRAHHELAKEYEKEKLRAQALFPNDVLAYNNEKNSWIRTTELAALKWASSL